MRQLLTRYCKLQIYPEVFPRDQLDAAQKVLQALLAIDLVSTLETVSSAMYCHLGDHNVQLWGCLSLQEIMICTRHRRGLLQYLAQHVGETYEQWERAILGNEDRTSVQKSILRNLFDEMDVNKDGKVRLSYHRGAREHCLLWMLSLPLAARRKILVFIGTCFSNRM